MYPTASRFGAITYCYDGHQFNQDVKRWSRGVFEWIADRVADDSSCMGLSSLALALMWPCSIAFFALSQAPPALAMKSAISTPVTNDPARSPPSADEPSANPTTIGASTATTPGLPSP